MPFKLVFHKNDKVADVLDKIKNDPTSWPNIEHVFVVDPNQKLVGTVDFKKILSAPKNISLDNLVSEDHPVVTVHSHQSNVAKIALAHGTENIPVIDEEKHFVGIIDATQILKILHEEHVENLMKFSGILDHESFVLGYKAKIFEVAKSRLPWLFFGLVGGGISTFIVQNFQQTIREELALAFFIPVIVYMNDAVGTQAQTVFVRNSALEKTHLVKSLLFETKVTFLIALVLSISMYIFADIWLDANVALVVTLSMFLGIMSSAIIGTFIPWALEKFGKDPAIGSGPFTTILQDLLSIVIYFTIASAFL